MFRVNALMPRKAAEAIGRFMKGDQVLSHPDHVARAAYRRGCRRPWRSLRRSRRLPAAPTSPSVARVTEATKSIEETEAASATEASSPRQTETV